MPLIERKARTRVHRLSPSSPVVWLLCLLVACISGAAWSLPAALIAKPAKQTQTAAADPAADRAARDRLAMQLRAAGLQAVVPEVSNGVATLEGIVRNEQQRKAAAAIAAKVPDVVKVENRVELHVGLSTRLRAAFDMMVAKLIRLLAATPLLLVAVAIVMLAAWIGGFFAKRLHWLRIKSSNPYMDGLLRRVVQTIAVLIGVLIALDLLGATSLVGAVLGSAGVVGLVVGFAFRDIAENYVSGVLLSIRRPFSPGDHVMIDTREGKVVSLSSRATVLMTMDGNELMIPNAMVFKSVMLNYSRNPKRRFEFAITVDVTESISKSMELALAQLVKVPGVLDDPAPSSVVKDFAPTGIVLQFFGWVDQRETDLGKSRGEAIRLVKAAFANAGIDPPQTTYNIVSRRASGEEAAPSKERESTRGAQADTSVNRDIDTQLAAAQRADDKNLLDHGENKP
ncbi:mechanosensitive ion channel [Luteimonas sp. SX5]|uniref:Small-conductance mechanosensitive channel n=1 Tax=Luteimonas galliterrae TaxID=2940486 RepID=A0ABT0MFM0_9GAMM|nr:mechanosensitive ion channel domain-containing protein [Luteimonas galliterrae]MCL1633473.1 mechanosensitive ion channel [Luteimonas galliterrae]